MICTFSWKVSLDDLSKYYLIPLIGYSINGKDVILILLAQGNL